MLASPLILGNDLRTVGRDYPDCLELILNPEIVVCRRSPLSRPIRPRSRVSSYSSVPWVHLVLVYVWVVTARMCAFRGCCEQRAW